MPTAKTDESGRQGYKLVHIRSDLIVAVEKLVPKILLGTRKQTVRVNWVIEEYCRIAKGTAKRRGN